MYIYAKIRGSEDTFLAHGLIFHLVSSLVAMQSLQLSPNAAPSPDKVLDTRGMQISDTLARNKFPWGFQPDTNAVGHLLPTHALLKDPEKSFQLGLHVFCTFSGLDGTWFSSAAVCQVVNCPYPVVMHRSIYLLSFI